MLGSKRTGNASSLRTSQSASNGRTNLGDEMTLTRYWGYSPMRVGKDTKYSVTASGDIKLEYQETARVRWLLATGDHPDLVEMVNRVKESLTGRVGGAFYINEFR